MTTTNDILHSAFITPAQSRERLLQTVAKFAGYYGIPSNHYTFSVEPPAIAGSGPSIRSVRFNPATSTFNVSCSVSQASIAPSQQLDLEDELTAALRQQVLGPLALRALPADDKLQFLKAIVASRTQERAFWNDLDARYPRSTELDKARMLAHVATREVEPTDDPARLSATQQPWLEVVTRRQLRNPREDIPEVMRCLAGEVRRHGMNSQKVIFQLLPLPSERPLPLAGSLSPVQIGDGYYEGHIIGNFTAADGTRFLIQRDRLTDASLMHPVEAFRDDVPYGRCPVAGDAITAIAYANGKASWEYPLHIQERVAASLQQKLPPGASLHLSSPWDTSASFRGRIVDSPDPKFVLQQDENNANTYYAHLAQAFDYSVHPKRGVFNHTAEQEPVEIANAGAGRMVVRPHFRDIAGVQKHDFAQQLEELRQKIPPSAQPLLQVAQPQATYMGPPLAHTQLLVLQGAYPTGQSKAVPVVHWRADLRMRTGTLFNPEQYTPKADIHVAYGRDGQVNALFIYDPASWDMSTNNEQLASATPRAGAQESAPVPRAQDIAQSSVVHTVLERNIPEINLTQLNLGEKTVLHNPQTDSQYQGSVVAQDAHRIFLQLANTPRHVIVFPKSVFAGSPLPRVDSATQIKINYYKHRAAVEQLRTLDIASSNNTHSTNNSPLRPTNSNFMHARSNTQTRSRSL